MSETYARPSEVYAAPGPSDARPSCCQPANQPRRRARRSRVRPRGARPSAAFLLPPLALLLVLSAGAVHGQYVEGTIWLPDSFCGTLDPGAIACDTANSRVYVGGRSGRWVTVIDGLTHRRIARVPVPLPHDGPDGVRAFCYNPVSRKMYFASFRDSSWVTVVDADRVSVLANIPVRPAPKHFCFSHASNKVYCWTGQQNTIDVIDGVGDRVVASIPMEGEVRSMYWVEAGDKVYAAYENMDTVAVIDCRSDSVVRILPFRGAGFSLVASTRRLYCACGPTVRVLDVDTDSIVGRIAIGIDAVFSAYNPRDEKLYFAAMEWDRPLVVVAAGPDTVTATLPVHLIDAIAYSPVFDKLYCATKEPFGVAVVDGRSDSLLAHVSVPVPELGLGRIRDLAVVPANGAVYCADSFCCRAVVVDGAGDSLAAIVTVGVQPVELEHAPSMGKLYCATAPDTVYVIDEETRRVVGKIGVGKGPTAMLYCEATRKLYVTNHGDTRYITIVDATADTVLAHVIVGTDPEHLAYSPVQNKVYCSMRGGVDAFDGASNQRVASIRTAHDPSLLVYNPFGDRVYCNTFGSLLVIDCGGDSVVRSFGLRNGGGGAVLCERTGKAYYGGGNVSYVVDARADTVRDTLHGIYAVAGEVAMDRLGSRVYFASGSGARVWTFDGDADTVVSETRVGRAGGFHVDYDSLHDRLYVASSGTDRVFVLNHDGDSILAEIPVGWGPCDIEYVPHSGRFYTADGASSSITVVRDTSPPGVAGPAAAARYARVGATVLRRAQFPSDLGVCDVYNALGARVARLPAGATKAWVALPPGAYFVRLGVGGPPRKLVIAR